MEEAFGRFATRFRGPPCRLSSSARTARPSSTSSRTWSASRCGVPNLECRQVFTVKPQAGEIEPPEVRPRPGRRTRRPMPLPTAKPSREGRVAAARKRPPVVEAEIVEAAVVSPPKVKEVVWSEGADVPPPPGQEAGPAPEVLDGTGRPADPAPQEEEEPRAGHPDRHVVGDRGRWSAIGGLYIFRYPGRRPSRTSRSRRTRNTRRATTRPRRRRTRSSRPSTRTATKRREVQVLRRPRGHAGRSFVGDEPREPGRGDRAVQVSSSTPTRIRRSPSPRRGSAATSSRRAEARRGRGRPRRRPREGVPADRTQAGRTRPGREGHRHRPRAAPADRTVPRRQTTRRSTDPRRARRGRSRVKRERDRTAAIAKAAGQTWRT